ncbi:hypothetical protein HDU84_006583 [Entophlyctis sp. JEL0112]|nr:hypothetical protein HDU84_006583 [Entophlyctis sp. JEL0112]
MSWLETAATVAVALVAVAITIAYMALVPSDDGNMGSLVSVTGGALEEVNQCNPLHPESKFAPLPLGPTHYRFLGPASGPRVVCIHGITGTSTSSPRSTEILAERGYRVLIYDVYGRGYSSSPGTIYSGSLYAQQLKDLLDHVGWESATVLGVSMGGGVAVTFADIFPERVDNLVLICPAGLSFRSELPINGKFVALPVIGSVFAHTFGRQVLLSNLPKEKSPVAVHYANVVRMNILHHPGFIRAFLSTIRNGPIRDMGDCYERVGKAFQKKTVCVWGNKDKVTKYPVEPIRFKKCFPEATFHEIENGEHDMIIFRPDEVMSPIISFLEQRN